MSKPIQTGGIATSTRVQPPLKWHVDGGKHYLAPKIIALMPAHIHYVEPYAGGLSVLLAKDPEGVSEVVNDLNGDLTRFWNVMMNIELFPQFHRHVTAMPFSESLWNEATESLSAPDFDDVSRAVAFFVACRQSLAGRMESFAPISRTRTRRGMNEQASAWINAVDGLPAVHARLRRVVILNRDALGVIRQQDGPDTLFYLDPPYLHETRATTGEYAHEMTWAEHVELLRALAKVKGRFLLSGYRSDLYDAHANLNGLNRHDFTIPNNSAGGKLKRKMVECVWTNY